MITTSFSHNWIVPFFLYLRRSFGVAQKTSLNAEAWAPADGSKWVETDFEADIKKLESEAEERMDAKIDELMSKIESTGKSD